MYPRIRALREHNDLTQRDVAAILSMSQSGYSKYENGEADIPTKVLIKLSRYYQTSVDYLLSETDMSKPLPPAGKRAGHTDIYTVRTPHCR